MCIEKPKFVACLRDLQGSEKEFDSLPGFLPFRKAIAYGWYGKLLL